MRVKVRFPDNSVRDVEVTAFRTELSDFSPPIPDLQEMFYPKYLVLETLGPDSDGCYYTLLERPH